MVVLVLFVCNVFFFFIKCGLVGDNVKIGCYVIVVIFVVGVIVVMNMNNVFFVI